MNIIGLISTFLLVSFLNANNTFYYENNKKVYLTKINTDIKNTKIRTARHNNISYYKTSTNNYLGVKDRILIKTKKNINSIIQKYSCTLIRSITSRIYLIKIDNNSDIFDIANKLYEDNDVIYAHPNFIRKIQKR